MKILKEGIMKTLSSTPSNPDTGYVSLYFKDDGKLYKKVGSIETEIGQGEIITISGQIWDKFYRSNSIGEANIFAYVYNRYTARIKDGRIFTLEGRSQCSGPAQAVMALNVRSCGSDYLATHEYVDTTQLATAAIGHSHLSMAIDSSYCYYTGRATTFATKKMDVNTGVVTSYANEIVGDILEVDDNDIYIYALNGGNLSRYLKSDASLDSAVAGTGTKILLTSSNIYLIDGTDIHKYDRSTFTFTSTHTLASAANILYSLIDGGYMYILCDNNDLVKYNLSTDAEDIISNKTITNLIGMSYYDGKIIVVSDERSYYNTSDLSTAGVFPTLYWTIHTATPNNRFFESDGTYFFAERERDSGNTGYEFCYYILDDMFNNIPALSDAQLMNFMDGNKIMKTIDSNMDIT